MSERAGTDTRDIWAHGGVTFAGMLLGAIGTVTVLQGIVAVAEDDVYAPIGSYVFEFSLTGWGVIHLALGALMLLTGIGLLTAKEWARGAGLALAVLSLIEQFLFLPYAPVWSALQIALAVFVIWALAAHQPIR